MTDATTIPAPAGWDQAACVHWAANRRVKAVQRTLAALGQSADKDPRLALQAAYYLFLLNDFGAAATILAGQLKTTPDHFEVLLNLAVCHERLRRSDEAVVVLERALTLDPDNAVAHDALTACFSRLGRFEDAARAGSRSLDLKDQACDPGQIGAWRLPDGSPGDFAGQPGKRDVIAFSLWGDGPVYLRGALRNLLLAPDLFPGWTVRFHVDDSVPAEFVGLIGALGGEVVSHAAGQTLRQKLCWRFEAANDPAVGRFLVRDADSVISPREVQAVQAWIASDRWFHVMRDSWTHTDLMLAGMWGGVAGVLPDLSAMLASYRSVFAETPNIDQWFLRDRVWAYVRNSVLAHDRLFRPVGAEPMPGPPPTDDQQIGQEEYGARGAWQETVLAPWIARYPCLARR